MTKKSRSHKFGTQQRFTMKGSLGSQWAPTPSDLRQTLAQANEALHSRRLAKAERLLDLYQPPQSLTRAKGYTPGFV